MDEELNQLLNFVDLLSMEEDNPLLIESYKKEIEKYKIRINKRLQEGLQAHVDVCTLGDKNKKLKDLVVKEYKLAKHLIEVARNNNEKEEEKYWTDTMYQWKALLVQSGLEKAGL